MQVTEFVARYPRLYHMAEKGTWPAIRQRGLLSTTALLDRHEIVGPQRHRLQCEHRPEKVPLGSYGNQVVLRDQKPMPPERLMRALSNGVSPSQWYQLLNGKVFMWAEEERLLRLLNATHYRKLEHHVLTIDTASMVAAYEPTMWLCHMNSGNTFPMPTPRDIDIFKRIADFPTTSKKKVVEVVVDYSVPDVATYVVDARRMRGSAVLERLKLG